MDIKEKGIEKRLPVSWCLLLSILWSVAALLLITLPSVNKGKHASEGRRGCVGCVFVRDGRQSRLCPQPLLSRSLRPFGVRRSFAGAVPAPVKAEYKALLA